MADVVDVVIVDVIVDERLMNMSSGGTSRACEEVVPVIDVVVVWDRTCLRSRWTDVSAVADVAVANVVLASPVEACVRVAVADVLCCRCAWRVGSSFSPSTSVSRGVRASLPMLMVVPV